MSGFAESAETTPETVTATSAQTASTGFAVAKQSAGNADMKWTRTEMIGKNRNPVSVSSIGGGRWTLLQRTERGVAMNGVYDTEESALAYAEELGLEIVDAIEDEKK